MKKVLTISFSSSSNKQIVINTTLEYIHDSPEQTSCVCLIRLSRLPGTRHIPPVVHNTASNLRQRIYNM